LDSGETKESIIQMDTSRDLRIEGIQLFRWIPFKRQD